MLLYTLPARVTTFPRTFFIKDNANIGRNPPFCLFAALSHLPIRKPLVVSMKKP